MKFSAPSTPLRIGTPNALDIQLARALDWDFREKALRHDNGFIALAEQWGKVNGLRRRDNSFTLEAVARGMRSGGRWGKPYKYPGCDDPLYFKRGAVCAAVMVRPYSPTDVEDLKLYAAEKALAVHMPANGKASFWVPGASHCVVLTHRDFGPIVWLEDQLEFQGGS